MKTAHNRRDLTEKRFGKLVVKKYSHTASKRAYWLCQCDCGNTHTVPGIKLTLGKSKSCGCYRRDFSRSKHTTHGRSNTPEYHSWAGMLNRCNNPKEKAFKNYGGRGIRVCKRWEKFENFYDDMGKRPSKKHTLDRVDNNMGYSPENCRWATRNEQANNTRSNTILDFSDKQQTISQWAKELGFSHVLIVNRLARGWSIEKTLSTPIDATKRNLKYR